MSVGAFTSGGVWLLTNNDPWFGGYSGLVLRRDGKLAAYSDMGSRLVFGPPDIERKPTWQITRAANPRYKAANDVESATYDPASGSIWIATEANNTIRRYDAKGELSGTVKPPAMADWLENGGPETMARLPDGRFIVIAESAPWRKPTHRSALLFPGDPVDGYKPLEFKFDPPVGYDPTDAVALPDGRVIILLRALLPVGLPPFGSKLVIADPDQIVEGKPWPWLELIRVEDLAPRENYEGITAAVDGKTVTLWLISDANDSALLQRTLLVKLVWKQGPA